MEAYATTQRMPLSSASESRSRSRPDTGARAKTISAPVAREGAHYPSTSGTLATALLDAFDDDALAMLAGRLAPYLTGLQQSRTNAAYTVGSLATELELSPKAIRSAIARGELAAVKRGSRWIISTEAVEEWARSPGPSRALVRRSRSSVPIAPIAAGPSLRSVLCGEGLSAPRAMGWAR